MINGAGHFLKLRRFLICALLQSLKNSFNYKNCAFFLIIYVPVDVQIWLCWKRTLCQKMCHEKAESAKDYYLYHEHNLKVKSVE